MIVPTTVATEPTTAVTSAEAVNCETAMPKTTPSRANAAPMSQAPYFHPRHIHIRSSFLLRIRANSLVRVRACHLAHREHLPSFRV
jgi:hypothetical protein